MSDVLRAWTGLFGGIYEVGNYLHPAVIAGSDST